MLLRMLFVTLLVIGLSACSSSDPSRIVRSPALRDPQAAPKVDVFDAAYIEVVRGGWLRHSERYTLEFPTTGNGTFRYIKGSKVATSHAMTPQIAQVLQTLIKKLGIIEPEDTSYSRMTQDGGQEYLYVRTHQGKCFVLQRVNAPDATFDQLWDYMEGTMHELLGTFEMIEGKDPEMGPSDELSEYIKIAWLADDQRKAQK